MVQPVSLRIIEIFFQFFSLYLGCILNKSITYKNNLITTEIKPYK